MVSLVYQLLNLIRNLAFRGHSIALFAFIAASVGGSIALAKPSASPPSPPSQISAEAVLSVETPYVQQTVIYTVRVVSRTNVLAFSLDPPTAPGAALELLEDKPRTYARPTVGGQMVVNEYRYALTPLVAGRIEVPPTRLSGKAESPQSSYQGSPRREIAFQVRTQRVSLRSKAVPPNAVQPWLPLQALELVSEGEILRARVGEPFTLSLWLRAVGARGQRLPILADLLQGPDFRIYAEKTVEYWQDATPEGNAVRGQRHETLTVVPLKSGNLRLPALHISWWDTTKDQPTTLEWQTPEITITGGASDAMPTMDNGGIFHWLLILPAAAIFFLLGWWIGRTQPKTEESEGSAGLTRVLNGWRQISERLRPATMKLVQQVGPIYQTALVRLEGHIGKHLKRPLTSVAPHPFADRIHRFFARILPATFHTRRLLHHVQAAGNVDAISEALKVYATAALAVPPHSSLTVVAETMIQCRPELDGPTLLQLIHQLDAALYGESNASKNQSTLSQKSEERLDIDQWKQNFRKIVRFLSHHQHRASIIHIEKLPSLNPGTEEVARFRAH